VLLEQERVRKLLWANNTLWLLGQTLSAAKKPVKNIVLARHAKLRYLFFQERRTFNEVRHILGATFKSSIACIVDSLIIL
jgi:predicted DCC family thiol-disulfide oxidoreductase YuxK